MPLKVAHFVRHAGRGGGVSEVVAKLHTEMESAGFHSEIVDLRRTWFPARATPAGKKPSSLRLAMEVIWYSAIGTLVLGWYRLRHPDVVRLVHNDAIGGDVYINHGLIKIALNSRPSRKHTHPFHIFLLIREYVRFRWFPSSHIVCLTDHDQTDLRSAYPRLNVDMSVIHNGVDIDFYAVPSPEDRAELRALHRIDPRTQVGLFVGHDFRRKGLYQTLDAMRLQQSPELLIVIGGTSESVAKASEEAADLGERVRFAGPQPDAREYFQLADYLILPSQYESFGLVLIESLACGTPIITAPVGVAPQLIAHGVGQLIEETTPLGVAAAIRAWSSKPQSSSTAETCRHVAELFAWPGIAASYSALAIQVQKAKRSKGNR